MESRFGNVPTTSVRRRISRLSRSCGLLLRHPRPVLLLVECLAPGRHQAARPEERLEPVLGPTYVAPRDLVAPDRGSELRVASRHPNHGPRAASLRPNHMIAPRPARPDDLRPALGGGVRSGALSSDRRTTSAMMGDLIAEEVGWASDPTTRIAYRGGPV